MKPNTSKQYGVWDIRFNCHMPFGKENYAIEKNRYGNFSCCRNRYSVILGTDVCITAIQLKILGRWR